MSHRFTLTVLGLAVLAAGCVSVITPGPAPDYQIPRQRSPGDAQAVASDAESRRMIGR